MTRVGVDVGGTFTDLVAVRPDGSLEIRKVDSTPADPAVGLFRALDALGDEPIDALVHGTTVATNALLERRGARVVLITTAGFEDLLWLRRQDRAGLYDLARHHPPPLVARDDVIGVNERMGPDGPIVAITEQEVERVTEVVRTLAPESIAISLLFAFRHPGPEERIAAALRAALPGIPVAASHEVLPFFREFERTSTTTAEAYLRPKVAEYVRKTAELSVQREVGSYRIMTSNGGSLAPRDAINHAANLALSGPVGGVVAAGWLNPAVGRDQRDLLTLDMGGTSADASLVVMHGPGWREDGLTERTAVIAGVPLSVPAILIETVSAGGGSIAAIDEGGALRVGPRSAGAVPGPACYGRGGEEPTVTDACLLLGWLDAEYPLAESVRLDRAAAERAVARLGGDVASMAAGIVNVASAVMARALRRVSVARGLDPRQMALVPFGGAGPLFGCALADALGMSRVIIPPHPGVFSALGLAMATERRDILASFHARLEDLDREALSRAFAEIYPWELADRRDMLITKSVDCRFAGQGYEVTVGSLWDDPEMIGQQFIRAHEQRHGHADPEQPIEVVNLRIVVRRGDSETPLPLLRATTVAPVRPGRRPILTRDGNRVDADIYPLDDLPADLRIDGPAVLAGRDATALVEPGWQARTLGHALMVIDRA
ncbi:MAG: hydantoinase/oxoprolinase family protein [Gemmatimonadales bacterium]